MTWYDRYKDKFVGFVVETRHGEFKPLLGKCIESDGDDDCLIHVVGEQPPQDTLEGALAFYEPDIEKFARVFRKPTRSGGVMGHWLVVLVTAEDGADPRETAA